mmetsp:Transcript_73348/g.90035  ORF Transcript_73348/g.90035 Transcript_73348/m.90035 type:complete len:270 (-) Transcript_73348:1338-2147(-)
MEGSHNNMLLVHLEESPQSFTGIRASKAICTQDNVLTSDIWSDEHWVCRHIVGNRHSDDIFAEALLNPGRLCLGTKTGFPLGRNGITLEFAIACGTPQLDTNTIFRKDVYGIHCLLHDGPRPDQPDLVVGWLCIRKLVQAFDNALIHTLRFFWHCHILIVCSDVVDDILILPPHLFHSVFNDRSHFIAKSRIIALDSWASQRDEQRVSILMLQSFSIESSASISCTDEKSSCTSISCLPNAVTNTLEAKHGVVDEEGQSRRMLRRIGCC